jgi:uncharacterized ion transporter superfamily protein YfcC
VSIEAIVVICLIVLVIVILAWVMPPSRWSRIERLARIIFGRRN